MSSQVLKNPELEFSSGKSLFPHAASPHAASPHAESLQSGRPSDALTGEGTDSTSSATNERPQLIVIPGGMTAADPSIAEPSMADSLLLGTRNSHENTAQSAPNPSSTPVLGVSIGGIRITLDFFQGPMDLFLHLVQQQEVDIAHVSMRLVAEQYLSVVSELMSQLESDPSGFLRYDLEQVSEYLVIAATLTAIKSAAVLPHASMEGLQENLEPSDQGFLEELRERLRVYEQTKRRAEELNRLPQLGVDTFQRLDRKALLPTAEMLCEPDDPRSLGEHLSRLLKRIGAMGNVFKVKLESVSIVSSMMRMIDLLNSEKRSTFQTLLSTFRRNKPGKGNPSGKGLVIGTFLAVLELMKRGVLVASQSDDGSDIEISLLGLESATTSADGASLGSVPLVSEFDEEVNGVP